MKMRFPQSITLEKFVSRDAYHNITYGAPSTVHAAIEYIIKKIIDATGTEIVTSAWIALPPNTSISYNDKITLPDNSTPVIGSIAPVFNYRTKQNHYIEVYVSKARQGG